jgi:hypothetical protein
VGFGGEEKRRQELFAIVSFLILYFSAIGFNVGLM